MTPTYRIDAAGCHTIAWGGLELDRYVRELLHVGLPAESIKVEVVDHFREPTNEELRASVERFPAPKEWLEEEDP